MSTLSAFLCFFLVQPFMGDNYCDSINNRAFCNYDGGDCCASTVKTKKVGMPLPLFTGNFLVSAALRLEKKIFLLDQGRSEVSERPSVQASAHHRH